MKFSSINLYFAAIPKSFSKKPQMSLKQHQPQQPEKTWPLYLTQYFFHPVTLSPMFNFQFTGLAISGKRFNIDWTVEHSNSISPERLLSRLPEGDWGKNKNLIADNTHHTGCLFYSNTANCQSLLGESVVQPQLND